jgi:hypothetical protein
MNSIEPVNEPIIGIKIPFKIKQICVQIFSSKVLTHQGEIRRYTNVCECE